jgi:hypothetical protein
MAAGRALLEEEPTMSVGETVDTADLSRGRWTPRRLRAILRREGATGLLGRALERLSWRRAGLYICILDEVASVAGAAAAPADEVVQLNVEDVPAYRAFRPEAATAFVERLRAGRACFAVRHDGRVLAATWVAVCPAWVEHLRREFRPAPDEIYIFDSLTAAEHRGGRFRRRSSRSSPRRTADAVTGGRSG